MAQPLNDQINSALGGSSRLKDVEAVIAAAQAKLGHLKTEIATAEARSIDPAVTTLQAREARDLAADLAHDIRRLGASLTALEQRRQSLLADESYEERRRHYAAAREARDNLVERVRIRYPAIALELLQLVEDLAANEAECAAVNAARPKGEPLLESAEALARDCAGNWYRGVTPVARLKDMKLPFLSSDGLLLPKPQPGNALGNWSVKVREMRAQIVIHEPAEAEAA